VKPDPKIIVEEFRASPPKHCPFIDFSSKYMLLSWRREAARSFVSLNISLSHSRSFEMTLLKKACV